jgi:hypothetical protein
LVDRFFAENRWTVLYVSGFALFIAAVVTGSGWFTAPATIFVLVAALGRPLAEVTWPGGSIKWQNEAIEEIWRITYQEVVDPKIRQAMEDAQREAAERGEGMGAVTSDEGRFARPVSPQYFARTAVEDVVRTLRHAEEFAQSRRLRK